MSLRAIIKQRRQWALRATRRNEGPNVNNQRLLNIKDGVIPALLHLALQDGAVDWEIARNGMFVCFEGHVYLSPLHPCSSLTLTFTSYLHIRNTCCG